MITISRNSKRWGKVLETVSAANLTVKVGLISGQGAEEVHPGSGLTNAELGALMENGSPGGRIVARPWLAPSMKKGQLRALKILEKGLQVMFVTLRPQVIRTVLGQVGARLAADAQNYITSGQVQPDIKVETMRRKGSWIALQATGQMKRAITWAVEKLS